MKRDLSFTMEYPFPIEEVWWAVTDRDAIAEWLMPNDFAPVVGHRFQYRTKPTRGFDGIVDCEVLEVEPPRRLVYSWKGGPIDTVVTVALAPTATGTRLELTQAGFRGLPAVLVSFLLGSGWKKKILPSALPAVLRRRHATGVRDGG